MFFLHILESKVPLKSYLLSIQVCGIGTIKRTVLCCKNLGQGGGNIGDKEKEEGHLTKSQKDPKFVSTKAHILPCCTCELRQRRVKIHNI